MSKNNTLFVRPEIVVEPNRNAVAEVQRPLSAFEAIYRISWIRKTAILLVLALVWEVYGRWPDNSLLFPSFSETLHAFMSGISSGVLLQRAAVSLETLLIGYGLGILLAGLLTTLAISSRIGNDFLETLTSMFNPLPAIALLPLALIWFGLGTGSIIFSLVHSVLIPAAFPSILTGLKIGWAFAWRTLIAAELVFGVSSGAGGLGWYIFENRNQLETANVFSGLFFVIMIGLFVENLIFAQIEKRTIRRWGMQH